MKSYDFTSIEKKWQTYWQYHHIYHTSSTSHKPKYYVLDMFPYPSGEGLHVGHLLGYVASDIVARYKRTKGYAVLHPMGFDAFGLPAEQFALQTGQHPATTTAKNVAYYKQQLQLLGLSYDWERAINTTDPTYYHWTQWIFIKLFNSWYDRRHQKAKPIQELIDLFEQKGTAGIEACCDITLPSFTAIQWKELDEKAKQQHLLGYRLAFLAYTTVNWCPALGTVLAHEEVKEGLSERGGYPVIQKSMLQWSLRIIAYADRLLEGLEKLQWPSSTKEMQRHWIGKSGGVAITFSILNQEKERTITIFTTRPDTIFGTTYLALAPEHPLVLSITTAQYQETVKSYITASLSRSERDRLAGIQEATGVFTGSFVLHPFTKAPIPIWITDYVLSQYGTGAIMGVPAHDSRDYHFAKRFQLPIKSVISGMDVQKEAYEEKKGTLIHSEFLNGLSVPEGIEIIIQRLEGLHIGKRQINYRLRNTIFSRQRYWGEPLPIYYKEDIPYALSEKELPLTLPNLITYHPNPTGAPPLASIINWHTAAGDPLECNTMPSWAGSSWYFFRYMDPHNQQHFVGSASQSYWRNVDLYIGGTEHTTGHLLYARFWTKFLYDQGYVNVDEPFQTLIHQGMIQNKSNFVYRIKGTNQFVSYHLRDKYETTPLHVPTNLIDQDGLKLEAFKRWRPELEEATFILEETGKYICGSEVEKMSKSKYNTINPERIIAQYGADTLRLYIMFLGPIDQAKPWDMTGIVGIFRFLVKIWRLFHHETAVKTFRMEKPLEAEQRILHKTIKKVEEDIQRYAFNTAISNLMILVNELTALNCDKISILEKLLQLLAPFAPHLAEELWQVLGHTNSITEESFPAYQADYIQEQYYEYPLAINGKVRSKATFSITALEEEIKSKVITEENIKKWLQGNTIKKIIIVPHKMINIVV